MRHRRLVWRLAASLLAVGIWARGAGAAPAPSLPIGPPASTALPAPPVQAAAATAPQPGDPVRGRAIVADRRVGLCLLCHTGPFPEVPLQGDLAPSLAGAGARWTLDQLRGRLEDPERFVPGSLMPAFGHREGLWRVAPAWQGRPLLTPQQIEDVAAFLATLRD